MSPSVRPPLQPSHLQVGHIECADSRFAFQLAMRQMLFLLAYLLIRLSVIFSHVLQFFKENTNECRDFLGDSVARNPPANAEDARDAGSIPGSGRSRGEGNGNPLQCSCL